MTLKPKFTTRKVAAIVTIIASIAGLGLISYAFAQAQSNLQTRISQFESDSIQVDIAPTSASSDQTLTLEFAEENQVREGNFEFVIKNASEFSYFGKITATSRVGVDGDEVTSNQELNLPAGLEQTVMINLPFTFLGAPESVEIELETTESLTSFTREFTAIREFSFPLQAILLADTDLGSIEVTASPERVVYSPDLNPALDFEVELTNSRDRDWESGLLEVDLITGEVEGEFVQPLFVEELAVAAESSSSSSQTFVFELPPANRLVPSTGSYKLRARYSGLIGARELSLSAYSAEFEIEVTGI